VAGEEEVAVDTKRARVEAERKRLTGLAKQTCAGLRSTYGVCSVDFSELAVRLGVAFEQKARVKRAEEEYAEKRRAVEMAKREAEAAAAAAAAAAAEAAEREAIAAEIAAAEAEALAASPRGGRKGSGKKGREVSSKGGEQEAAPDSLPSFAQEARVRAAVEAAVASATAAVALTHPLPPRPAHADTVLQMVQLADAVRKFDLPSVMRLLGLKRRDTRDNTLIPG
jgi:hypothetical protein